jgi:hypothetical protein
MVSIYSYFDESGKFQDHSAVSFGGVCGSIGQVGAFEKKWQALLTSYGMDSLSMKRALRHQIPLGRRIEALGATERAKALLQFVDCAKQDCALILGLAIDVQAFGSMSAQAHKQLTSDPYYASFASNIIEVMLYFGKGNHAISPAISVVCDDDEATAEATLRLYRKLKLIYDRKRFTSISFADDDVYPSLQAADMVSSLIRMEARRVFFSENYQYRSLYERLAEDTKSATEAAVKVGIFDKSTIGNLSDSFESIAKEFPEFYAASLVEKQPKRSRR